jgi:hypothetical protein
MVADRDRHHTMDHHKPADGRLNEQDTLIMLHAEARQEAEVQRRQAEVRRQGDAQAAQQREDAAAEKRKKAVGVG